jgi:nicotinamide-nucleotide amidase
MNNFFSLAQEIIEKLQASGKTLAVAESCTGGLLCNAFTDIPGASKVFMGGIVCYSNTAKEQVLHVPNAIIQQHGAVSAECSIALTKAVAEKFHSDYALSVTGFAGPDTGDINNPTGTIFIGLYHRQQSPSWRKLNLQGNRLSIKAQAVNACLNWLSREL